MRTFFWAAVVVLLPATAGSQQIVQPGQQVLQQQGGQTPAALAVPLDPKAASFQVDTARLQYLRALREPRSIDVVRQDDVRRQWYLEYGFKIGVTIVAILLLLWLIPQISSISLPFGGGVLQVTTLQPAPPPSTPIAGAPAAGVVVPPASTRQSAVLGFDAGVAQEVLSDKAKELDALHRSDVRLDAIHVTHSVRRVRGTLPLIEVRVQGDETALAKVVKVIYHLHPAVSAAPIITTDRRNDFAIRFLCTGEFMLYAFAYLESDDSHPIRLKRYLNLR